MSRLAHATYPTSGEPIKRRIEENGSLANLLLGETRCMSRNYGERRSRTGVIAVDRINLNKNASNIVFYGNRPIYNGNFGL